MQSQPKPPEEVCPVGSKPFLTVAELSEQLHISQRTLRNWCALERIPHLRIEGNIRFEPHQIAHWLVAQRHGS